MQQLQPEPRRLPLRLRLPGPELVLEPLREPLPEQAPVLPPEQAPVLPPEPLPELALEPLLGPLRRQPPRQPLPPTLPPTPSRILFPRWDR